MSTPVAIVFGLTFVIHLVSTLSYALRIAGMRTGRVAVSLALFNVPVLVSRTSNTFQGPLLAKHVESTSRGASQRGACRPRGTRKSAPRSKGCGAGSRRQTAARDVLRTAGGAAEAARSLLPDLVVHWHDAAFDAPPRIEGARLEASPVGLKFTGQHAPEGFCVARGAAGLNGGTVRAEELHRSIIESLHA